MNLRVCSGLGYFAAVTMAAIGLLYKVAMAANLRRSKAEEEMGRGFSASAISKNSARKGKAIEGMEEVGLIWKRMTMMTRPQRTRKSKREG